MTEAEKQIGRIRAVLEAAEDVIAGARISNSRDTIAMAKETAYDSIKGIVTEEAFNPWQE